MNYSNLTAEIKEFFIKDYSSKANELRVKAAKPGARKSKQFNASAQELELIIAQIKAS